MKIAILTKEFPPYIYGGAGVHVDYLTRELARLAPDDDEVHVLCFGDQKRMTQGRRVTGIEADLPIETYDVRHQRFLDAIIKDAAMVAALRQADVIHCHTWYTHLAGCLLKQMLDAPMVLTTHSLEGHRPWKEEQLGSAFRASLWIEKTAYRNADGIIAVSKSMKEDVQKLYGVHAGKVEVINNGIDEEQYRPKRDPGVLTRYGINPDKPFVLMVSRLTRQKGVVHFLEAIKHLERGVQAVLCASIADTEEYHQEVSEKVAEVRTHGVHEILWVTETVPQEDLVALYTHASIFVCPSIYEPFGITNLEAMACGTAVVASAVGGILEVVVDGETGRLVRLNPASFHNPEPCEPERFARDLGEVLNELLASPRVLEGMGKKARKRVEEHFTWSVIARKTLAFYKSLLASR